MDFIVINGLIHIGIGVLYHTMFYIAHESFDHL